MTKINAYICDICKHEFRDDYNEPIEIKISGGSTCYDEPYNKKFNDTCDKCRTTIRKFFNNIVVDSE